MLNGIINAFALQACPFFPHEYSVIETDEAFLEKGNKIHALNEKVNKLEVDILSLQPWVEFDLPMALTETKDCNIHKGVLPAECDTEGLSKDLEQEFGQVVMKVVHKNKEMQYVVLVCTKTLDQAVMEAVREKGFTESVFKEFDEVPEEALKRMEREVAGTHKEIADLADQIAKDAKLKEKIQEYYDVIFLEAEKQKNKTKLLKTSKTFLLEGWVPERLVDEAKEILEANPDKTFYYASTKSQKIYSEVNYPDDCFIVFGKESRGLSENILKEATNLVGKNDKDFEDVLTQLEQQRQQMEAARAEAEHLRQETAKIKQQSEEYSAQLQKEREKAMEQARREAESFVRRAGL